MARVLPDKKFSTFGREWSMNPGPFNIKEHVLICVFANAGAAFGNGGAYAVGIVTIIKAFYRRNISFPVGLLLVITTQVRAVSAFHTLNCRTYAWSKQGADALHVCTGVGLRMGRADEEVRDRAGADVVAAESRAGVPPQVRPHCSPTRLMIRPNPFDALLSLTV